MNRYDSPMPYRYPSQKNLKAKTLARIEQMEEPGLVSVRAGDISLLKDLLKEIEESKNQEKKQIIDSIRQELQVIISEADNISVRLQQIKQIDSFILESCKNLENVINKLAIRLIN